MRARRTCLAVTLAATIASGITSAALAQSSDSSVADFYRGKQMRFIIRSQPGGGYDLYSRLVAQFIGSHIPGKPTVIPQNMPGAGGLTAVNYIAAIAPRDGAYLTLISSSLPFEQALGLNPNLKADLRTFGWIGNLNDSNVLTYVWHTAKAKTFDDARRFETTLGSTGAGDISAWMPDIYNKVLGSKFKIIEGYNSSGAVKLAMERGEVDGIGSNPLASLLAASPDYLRDKKVNVLVQIGVRREAKLPDVPLLMELARNDQEREVLTFISKALATGRPIGVGPGVPKERVAALRTAFDEMLKDPAFIAQAAKQGADIGPMTGATVERLIDEVIGSPEATKAKVKALMPKQH